jgi:hypothetical protein
VTWAIWPGTRSFQDGFSSTSAVHRTLVPQSATWWQLDNVLLGSHSCDRVRGGLALGRVTDANTGAGLAGPATATPATAAPATAAPATAAPADVTPSAAPWTSIANYPVPIQDNLVDVLGGKVYSAYGWSGSATLADLYKYDPDTADWTRLASAADIREAPAGGFISDRLYATGGWGADGQPDPKIEAYDPDTNTWTTVADNPRPAAAAGSATLNGRLYVIGGCNKITCGRTDVHVYDPARDSWTSAADYPEPIAWRRAGVRRPSRDRCRSPGYRS